MWSDPNQRFLWRLKNEQLDLILADPIFLKTLRHDWSRMENLLNKYAEPLSAREIDLPDLVFNLPDTPPDSEGTPPLLRRSSPNRGSNGKPCFGTSDPPPT